MDDLKPPHKCRMIAKAPDLHEGREYWLGELTERLPEWPLETHCLHLRTPVKDVVFLFNRGDFEALAVFSGIFFGHAPNPSWVETQMRAYAVTPSQRHTGETMKRDHCPRCDSSSPRLHPAVQFEGEVQLCEHPWHKPTAAEIRAKEEAERRGDSEKR